MTSSAYIQPLGLKYILINTLSGNNVIFTFLFLFFISFLSGVFRLPQGAYFIFLALSGVMLYSWYIPDIFILTLTLGGLYVGYAVGRMVRK